MKIAALEYLWWGVSAGGRHYTGEVHHPDGTVEMIRKLSRKEAKQLAEEDESRFWGTETNRFETLADLEAAALKWCEKNLGDTWILLHHDGLNPNHVIGGKGYTKERLDKIERYQKWWWSLPEATRERRWDRAYKIWDKLLQPA